MHGAQSRRHFIGQCVGLSSAFVIPASANAINSEARVLALHNTHTDESVSVTYYQSGNYDSKSLARLNHLLRDHRENVVKKIDPALFDQLWHVQKLLNNTDSIEIISGYRSIKTNNMLRSKSQGVASNSYHPKGRAIDFRLPAIKTDQVRNVAMHLKLGGVGYYQKSDFVHIDSGPVRSW